MNKFGFKTLIFFLFFLTLPYAQEGTTFYRSIELPEVTDQAEVFSIVEDSRGYMWFGTSEGLFRFDGTGFKRHQNEYGNKQSLVDDVVYSLEEDAGGNIWIGTKSGGISILDPALDTFIQHRYNPNDTIPLANYFIAAIYEDSNGIVRVGSQGGGLGVYNADAQTINYLQKKETGSSISQNYVTKMVEDDEGYIWIGLNGGGINKFNPKTGQFEHFRFKNLDNATSNFRNNVIRDMFDDGNGNIWLATYGGFNKFNKSNGTFTHYDKENEPWLKSNSLNSISSISGKLYITAYDGFFYVYDPLEEKFIGYENVNKHIRSGYSDSNGLFWLGLTTGEVLLVSQNLAFPFYPMGNTGERVNSVVKINGNPVLGNAFSGMYFHPGNRPLGQKLLSDNSILCMEHVEDGSIWIGTNSGGINIYDPMTGENKVFRFRPGSNESLPHDTVLDIYADEFGDIWVGTLAGLGQWKKNSQSFLNRGSAQFKDILRLDRSELWAATNIGIAVIDPTTNAFHMKQADAEQHRDSLLHNQVNALYSPDRDSILIGSERGLNIFIRSRNEMVNVHEKLGLPYGAITDIVQDNHNNYWMVTDRGVLQVDLKNARYKFYDDSDGLNINKGYTPFIDFDPETNEILIAGIGGYYSFVPGQLGLDEKPVPLLLTEIKLFDKPIRDSQLLNSLKEKGHLELAHREDMVSFSFAGLDYVNPSKISYAYRLKGYNEDWFHTKDQVASFTNLEPGDYVFEVKSTNADGVWSETPTTVSLHIQPPLWATWWAYALYFLIAITIVYWLLRNFVLRERLKAQLRLEHLELEKLKEFSTMKSRFFSNISHEFRTPLTLIMGPIDDLLEKSEDPKATENLQIIKRNGLRLRRLIDQILDFSKLEAKKVQLKKDSCELFGLLRASAASFASLAERNKITYTVDIPKSDLWVLADSEKIETVLNNLISNALKFTPASGNVEVGAIFFGENASPGLKIQVADNGPGLSQEEKENIFERFYRVEQKQDAGGTGIGLALTKELVDLMEGSIRILGEQGKGSVFEVTLPLELVDIPEEKPDPVLNEITGNVINQDYTGRATHSILLVEDNKDLRVHFKNLFGEQWHVFEATDGEIGYAIAVEEVPDLIVSDLMMPKMNGNELCKALRKDERTAHIPFIMLTAKATEQDKVHGLTQGANDYITKPFNKKELFLKIQNLLTQRSQMQEKLRKELIAHPSESTEVVSEKERFIIKLRDYIVDHLDDSKMNVNSLSKEMGYSRIQLYRKVLGLTGLPTSDFIRQIRVHKAAELLGKKWGNVSEVAYAVGFNNLSYFTKSFKEVYKLTPSQFAKSKIQQPL